MKHYIYVLHWEAVRVDGRGTKCTVPVQTLWLVFGNKSTLVRVIETSCFQLNVLENKYHFSEYFTDMFFIVISFDFDMYITK